MDFFFVRDRREKYRFFSTEPEEDVAVPSSRTKKVWQMAKKKLLLLPPRLLRQEQAFIGILKIPEETISIYHSGRRTERRIGLRFFFFLQKQRSKHILLLIGESLLLPLSGLAALLPGPNVAFAILALLMYTHWQALRGINRLARKNHDFPVSSVFSEWEEAVDRGQEARFPDILARIEQTHNLTGLAKIIWK